MQEEKKVTYDPEQAIKAQEKYCREHGKPNFVPVRGKCFSCGYNIFKAPYGYSVEHAQSRLITGCPHCMTSFAE